MEAKMEAPKSSEPGSLGPGGPRMSEGHEILAADSWDERGDGEARRKGRKGV